MSISQAQVNALYSAALEADQKWSAMLRAKFGKAAGDARYDERGTSTPELAEAHKAFRSANDTYGKACAAQRLGC